ncbi:MAG: 4Fe-4S binding protein [Thermodesulfobacteriota bacterium]
MAEASMSPARKKKLKTLFSRMNRQNNRFFINAPPLLEAMDMVLSADELDYLLKLGTGAHDYESARQKSRMPAVTFEPFFETLIKKGFIHPRPDETGRDWYQLNAIAVGWFETQVHYLNGKPEEAAFSRKFSQYMAYFRRFNVAPLRGVQNTVLRPLLRPTQSVGFMTSDTASKDKRIIPINTEAAAPDSFVYPTSTVNDLIEDFDRQEGIYMFPCVCRHMAGVIDRPCRLDVAEQACIVFGDVARQWASHGYGRKISKSEAFEILENVRKKGAMHTVIHEKDDTSLPVVAVCNCCWDCCGILRPYNMGALALKYQRHFVARIIDSAACKGCSLCRHFCPTTAASVHDKKAAINPDKCIGCGLCAYHCKQNNIELTPDSRQVFLPLLKKSEIRIQPETGHFHSEKN